MAVTTTDIKWYKAVNASGDADTLGNRKGYNEIVSAVMNNLFPNVTQAERTQVGGITRYRKFFIHNQNTDELSFESVKVWLDFDSSAGDFFRICPGTYVDTQADAKTYKGGEQWTIGAFGGTGDIEVGDTVTSGSKTGYVEAISESNYIIVRNTSSPLNASTMFAASDVLTSGTATCTISGTVLQKNAFVGTGRLVTTAITAGNTSFVVDFFSAEVADEIKGRILPGDELVITDLEDVDDTTHHFEFVTVSAISWSSTQATITITTGTVYSYALSYTGTSSKAGDTIYTRICQIVDCGDIDAIADNVSDTSVSGVLDVDAIIAHNKGAITDTITITIASGGSSFTVAGTSGTSYTAGSVASDYHPTNPNTSSYYFTIPTSAWSGSFIAGETFTFDITEAAVGIWAKEIVPQDTASTSRNSTWFALCGESA
jgi:hypothetical protein